jgi:hypothetical protein
MTYVPEPLRRLVFERANGCCEYCRLGHEDNFVSHEVDHIIAEKHRGETTADNLCLSCIDCNRHKGTDFASIDLETGQVALLFDPRRDQWNDHFRLNGPEIEPRTPQGRVTVFLLDMNSLTQLAKRAELIEINRYPCQ